MGELAHGRGATTKVHSAGVRADVRGPLRPRRRLGQCGRGKLGPQRRTRDDGNEQTERGGDCDGGLPSSGFTGAPWFHSAPTVQQDIRSKTGASCENDQSQVCTC